MKLYNTLTRQLEDFKSINPPEVGMYSCGPTVYDHPHIGNMRTYVNTDVFKRVLEFNGFKVKQVMNITDVGHLLGDQDMGSDKIEKKAAEEKKSAWDIAKEYEKEFFEVMDELNIQRPTIVARATEHIKQIISLVQLIEANGFTYKTSDGIYFDTSKIRDYNKLSGMTLDKLKEGARVEKNPEKKNPTDFALWKFSPSAPFGTTQGKGSGQARRQMEWDSPWGVGFPGWHIECSAMGMNYLGDRFDIHTGGTDHIAIHHSNERAQNEAATGHEVVNFWVHNAFLLVESQKMSKSLGNFYTAADIKEKGFDLISLRYLFLTAHYRTQMNFTWEGLESSKVALERLKEMVAGWNNPENRSSLSQEKLEKVDQYSEKFREFINDDLNIPGALAVVWEMAKSNIPDYDKYDLITSFDEILGLGLTLVGEVHIDGLS